jgi:hypothetical protein
MIYSKECIQAETKYIFNAKKIESVLAVIVVSTHCPRIEWNLTSISHMRDLNISLIKMRG